MAFNVDGFRRKLNLDGARPNLFECRIPGYFGGVNDTLRFMAKTAQIPGSTLGVIEVPYFGRQVKLAGNRTFAEWNVTIINDENFNMREIFEDWHRVLNTNQSNLRLTRNSLDYGKEAKVIHYGKNGQAIKKYNFVGLWPSDISQIELDWGSNDMLEEFTVTFAYQYWTVDDSVDNNSDLATPVSSSADGSLSA